MQSFACRVCGQTLHFENSRCVSCGSTLGFSREERTIVPLDAKGRYVDQEDREWFRCRNLGLAGCTWLCAVDGGQCFACDLTRTRPHDSDAVGLAQLFDAERAKRHLVYELDTLGFPILSRQQEPEQGLCFDLLSSVAADVTIGHANGVITIDLAETQGSHRERLREQLDEPYRTMLGHFRHESGHYVEWQLVRDPDLVTRSRALFGDERTSYAEALERHYQQGPPAGWEGSYISPYATMHPFEDFAETWAHYLHICDTVETAAAYGLTTLGTRSLTSDFSEVVGEIWVPLSVALNMINRSMGHDDLYPFVIPAPVREKLDFVASLAGSHHGF